MSKKKTNLDAAFNRLRKLNINTTVEQHIELVNILFDLANDQFDKGMQITTEIYTK